MQKETTQIDLLHPQLQEWINEFYELYPNRRILFLYTAGSHFFDLNTPNSDIDFRGVYLPAPEEFPGENRRKQHERKTNDSKHEQNSNEDVDFLMFSLTKVFQLLKGGDFNVMEMLYCPENKILYDTPLMREIRKFRENLLVNDISAFLGFIKKEYVRYGVNINHYKAQVDLLGFLNELKEKQDKKGHTKLKEIWPEIRKYAEGENLISFTESLTGNNVRVPSLKIAQRLYQWTVKINYVTEAIEARLQRYGHRQKRMASTGKEYKGLYHALRLIYEANDLYDHGKLLLPFSPDRLRTLRKIKTGELPEEQVHSLIDNGIEELYRREKDTPSNKKVVSDRIDRILFNFHAKMELRKKFEVSKSSSR